MLAFLMSLFRSTNLKEHYGKGKDLHELDEEELIYFLENNSRIDTQALAAICSEILRRMNNQCHLFGENNAD